LVFVNNMLVALKDSAGELLLYSIVYWEKEISCSISALSVE
jgi:hypothetical protein